MILGITINPYSVNVSKELISCAKKLSIRTRTVDLPSLTINLYRNKTTISDKDGEIKINSLAPYLLFGFPAAINALRLLTKKAFCQNPVESVLIVDDKATTAERLGQKGVAQIPTIICSDNFKIVIKKSREIGYPIVIKRAHGAQGLWVRLVKDDNSLKNAFDEFMKEGRPTGLIIQPFISEAKGKAVRVIVTGGKFLAATERIAGKNEWRSNIANGATQYSVDLTTKEHELVIAATKAVGLRHAGLDLLRTSKGPLVLEINSCPDFTSMLSYFDKNLTEEVLKASIRK